MSKIINPFYLFCSIQLTPFILWYLLPDDIFIIALQGYKKAPMGFMSIAIYFILLCSFYFGYKVSFAHANKNALISSGQIKYIKFLHNCTLVLSLLSVFFVIKYVLSGGLDFIYEALINNQANEFKKKVYTANVVTQASIIFRHMILTSFVTWFILKHYDKKPKTLPIIIILCSILFLFTSSRLTLISIVVISILFHFNRLEIYKYNNFKILLLIVMLILIFGLGVITRSLLTWQSLSHSDNPIVNISYEFFGYLVSPVNYSVIIVEESIYPYLSTAIPTFFSFFISIFNFDEYFKPVFLKNISYYYNPSLNQIGLVGQLFSGFGYCLFIPAFLYGYLSGIAYRSFMKQHLLGMLLYPFFCISIFDSFRGLLLTQNIMAANWLFICCTFIFYKMSLSISPKYVRGIRQRPEKC